MLILLRTSGFHLREERKPDGLAKRRILRAVDRAHKHVLLRAARLAWRVADTFAPVKSLTALLDASRAAAPSETTPVALADAGVENVNARVDDLITTERAAPDPGQNGTEVLELHDRGVVALPET